MTKRRAGQAAEGARHPIGVVARRTGLSVHALRAWEQRYAVVDPARTSGGQRLYTDDDVARLRLLARATMQRSMRGGWSRSR